MKISVLLVDDELFARRRLRSLLEADPDISLVGECGDGIRAAEMIKLLKPALVFLDVQIPGADGFGVLEEVAKCCYLPTVVFVTAHREYAIPAFEAQALDYILKPFRRSRFSEVLTRAKTHICRNLEFQRTPELAQQIDEPDLVLPGFAKDQSSELLLIKSGARLLFIKMAEIRWVEAERDYLRLHLEKDTHFIRETMNNLEGRLDQNAFIRIHRSTIVNVNEICEILPLLGGDYSVVMRDRKHLTLSRRYRSSFNQFLRRTLKSF